MTEQLSQSFPVLPLLSAGSPPSEPEAGRRIIDMAIIMTTTGVRLSRAETSACCVLFSGGAAVLLDCLAHRLQQRTRLRRTVDPQTS